MYAKAHPFGYKPVKVPKGHRADHKGEPVKEIQTIEVECPYDVSVRDEKGNIVREKGKPVKQTFTNTITRSVKQYDKPKKGRTFAEMVYESIPVNGK